MFNFRKKPPIRRDPSSVQRNSKSRLRVEELEMRLQPSAVPGYVLADQYGFGFSGYSPTTISEAYGINELNISKPGAGETIAIVDAYESPNIQADVATFDSHYNLPAINLTVVNDGATKSDPTGGWELETALDVEWAHAIAPYANIILVEAANDSVNAAGAPMALLHAVTVAASQNGVSIVSMSWGVPEFSKETLYDSDFNVPGVTFVAASGDTGTPPIWPAVSPYVVSVGGTTLQVSASGAYDSESGWGNGGRSGFLGGSGGGVSQYETEPAYQQSSYISGVTDPTGMRMNPDVSYDANPSTGVAVYDETNGGWMVIGGTSAGTPQWGALIALADQLRATASPAEGSLSSTQTLTALYQEQADFHDITAGNNGYFAGKGYDLVTGLGSPVANLLVPALAAQASAPGIYSGPSNSNPTGGSGNSGSGSSSTFTVTATSFDATSGVEFTEVIATIADTDSSDTDSTFTATILWGDGTASAGTITVDPNGGFDISGTHTYTISAGNAPGGGCWGMGRQNQGGGGAGTQVFRVTVVVANNTTQQYALAYTRATVAAASTTTENSDLNQQFVIQTYESLLGRAPDAAGLAYWTSLLNQGASRTAVVQQIEQSQEYLNLEVEAIYEKLLQRPADAAGLSSFTSMLANGATVESVEATIAGSQEYFDRRGGGTTAGFINALYVDNLDRTADAAGEASFEQALAQGALRAAIASAIFGSAEYQADLINRYYQTYLGRAADSTGLANFMTAMNQGATNQAVIAAIVGSNEFFDEL